MMEEVLGNPQLIYLALLGLLIMASLIGSYRRQLGLAAQHAAIWVLIFAGGVLVFSFGDVLRAELMPGRALVTDGETIELVRARDGHFYAELELNGAPVTFIVDTGATGIVLTQEAAVDAGLEIDALRFIGSAATANGSVPIAAARIDSVVFGPREDRNVRVAVNSGAMPESLLGMDYLRRFRRIEVEGSRLRLIP
ncbi:MAG: TIGR02281 family clan AA aspartic protease [Pseudomonadota bacterium]